MAHRPSLAEDLAVREPVQLVDSASALAAATAAARSHGLPTRDARVLRDLTNLLVHLSPAPVVARVPLTLSRLRGRD